MFLIAATKDSGRTRACVATAVQALAQHRDMARAGLGPSITDLAGRRRSVASLRGQAKAEASRATGPRAGSEAGYPLSLAISASEISKFA